MSKPNPRKSDGTKYRKLRLWLKSQGQPCWICREFGRPGDIDYSLPYLHPFAFELDHLVPISKGGDPYDRKNCAASHRCCNQWRGNKSVEEVKRLARSNGSPEQPPQPRSVEGTTSREW